MLLIISLSERAQYSFAQDSIQEQDRVFVANELSNTISVIDPKNKSVEKTIDFFNMVYKLSGNNNLLDNYRDN
ncbi:MAG: hypothetical protein ACR2F1_10435 [Nitrososphaeraceae archaeon]